MITRVVRKMIDRSIGCETLQFIRNKDIIKKRNIIVRPIIGSNVRVIRIKIETQIKSSGQIVPEQKIT